MPASYNPPVSALVLAFEVVSFLGLLKRHRPLLRTWGKMVSWSVGD